MAVGAPWIATSDPTLTNWGQIRKPPSLAHPFGTDDSAADGFSRVVWGTRISMQAGRVLILLAIAIGVPLGLAAGYYRGRLDQLINAADGCLARLSVPHPRHRPRDDPRPLAHQCDHRHRLGATPTYIRLTRGLVLSAAPRTTCRARAPSARATCA